MLKHYLTTNAHIILIQVINTWFDIEEKNEADAIIYDQLNHDNEVKVNLAYLGHFCYDIFRHMESWQIWLFLVNRIVWWIG